MTDDQRKIQTLTELQRNLAAAISSSPATQGVWVTAELSDVAVRGGHCYLELIEKDPNTGVAVAKARAVVWATQWRAIGGQFQAATGQTFKSGLKVMVRVSARYHVVYGLSLVIDAIDPNYTMGDLERRRREILERLKREGVIDDNRKLQFPELTQRIAIVSARGAAGYGDFMHQLYERGGGLRFKTRLFESIMQGDRTAVGVIAALDAIAAEQEQWDCVVIIRGGGATSDLSGFEDYDLANNVAQFPLPVIVGIGHERDITVLDYVARQRVKTPTAAAEFLVNLGLAQVERLQLLSQNIVAAVRECTTGAERQLAYIEGQLPMLPMAAIHRAEKRLNNATMLLTNISARRLQPMQSRLDRYADAIRMALAAQLQRRNARLDALQELLGVLSPEATLRRGYSITRVDGHAVTSADQVPIGADIETTLAGGVIHSTRK
jgi:exodeoxyribonuclease VII large subunit